jgi:hypothetical protein
MVGDALEGEGNGCSMRASSSLMHFDACAEVRSLRLATATPTSPLTFSSALSRSVIPRSVRRALSLPIAFVLAWRLPLGRGGAS